jgi:hypothetical protein
MSKIVLRFFLPGGRPQQPMNAQGWSIPQSVSEGPITTYLLFIFIRVQP